MAEEITWLPLPLLRTCIGDCQRPGTFGLQDAVNSKKFPLKQNSLHIDIFNCCKSYLVWTKLQWWSLETRLEGYFCESRSLSRRFQVSSRSRRLQVSGLWILQRNVLVKFLQFNDFCLFYLQIRNNQYMSENIRIFETNSTQNWWRHLKKIRQNAQISSLESRSFWWSLGLDVLPGLSLNYITAKLNSVTCWLNRLGSRANKVHEFGNSGMKVCDIWKSVLGMVVICVNSCIFGFLLKYIHWG